MKWLPPPSVPSCRTQVSSKRFCIFASRGMPVGDAVERARERLCGVTERIARIVLVEADGHRGLDRAAHAAQASGRSAAVSERRTAPIPQPMSTPTAAGMIAPLVGITAPDRRTDPGVDVGHRGDVAEDERQPRDVDELLQRLRLDVVRPDVDRDAAVVDRLPDRHGYI